VAEEEPYDGIDPRKIALCWLVCALVLWGPRGSSWQEELMEGIYFVGLPVATWWALEFTWRFWKPSARTQDLLCRALLVGTAVILLAGVYDALEMPAHYVCSKEVMTRDGTECVGEDVLVPGADRGQVIFLSGAAAWALWAAFAPRKWQWFFD
jgi:hypothetical protein